MSSQHQSQPVQPLPGLQTAGMPNANHGANGVQYQPQIGQHFHVQAQAGLQTAGMPNANHGANGVQYHPQIGQHFHAQAQAGQRRQPATQYEFKDAQNLNSLHLLRDTLMGQPLDALRPEGRQNLLELCARILQPIMAAGIQAERQQHAQLQMAHQQLLGQFAQQMQATPAPIQTAASIASPSAPDFAALRRNDPAAVGIKPMMMVRGRSTTAATNGLKRQAPTSDITQGLSKKAQKMAVTSMPAPMVDLAATAAVAGPASDGLLGRQASAPLPPTMANSAQTTPGAKQEIMPLGQFEPGVGLTSDPAELLRRLDSENGPVKHAIDAGFLETEGFDQELLADVNWTADTFLANDEPQY